MLYTSSCKNQCIPLIKEERKKINVVGKRTQCSKSYFFSSMKCIHVRIAYVFCDENCKLKIKSTRGRYYMFNSKDEFFNIITRLDFEDCATDEHYNDENDEELYY